MVDPLGDGGGDEDEFMKSTKCTPKKENYCIRENEVVLSESTRRHRLALFRNGPEAFDESDTMFRGKKRVKRQPMTRDDDMRMSDDDVQMRDWQGDMGVQELSIVAVLVALSKDMVKHDFETPKSTILGNNWILNELAALDRAIHT
ncbi:hypothetical protein GN958_ATG05172 [Phytophthora infestans]|uniref:Uncharacterized protein n=1 Tax=Phytophthora infestans TaxID=4787 RepID=A0A8S9V2L1_PHYIN|nr:hypothetical protein GN958_ATG05172 [Phytophthora infestans]KAI9980771.1 hypothetical protein PInf_010090 [Phytophthora infestans]